MTKKPQCYALDPAPDEVDALQEGDDVLVLLPLPSLSFDVPLPYVRKGSVVGVGIRSLYVRAEPSSFWSLCNREGRRSFMFWRDHRLRGRETAKDAVVVPATPERLTKLAEWKRRDEARLAIRDADKRDWHLVADMAQIEALLAALGQGGKA